MGAIDAAAARCGPSRRGLLDLDLHAVVQIGELVVAPTGLMSDDEASDGIVVHATTAIAPIGDGEAVETRRAGNERGRLSHVQRLPKCFSAANSRAEARVAHPTSLAFSCEDRPTKEERLVIQYDDGRSGGSITRRRPTGTTILPSGCRDENSQAREDHATDGAEPKRRELRGHDRGGDRRRVLRV